MKRTLLMFLLCCGAFVNAAIAQSVLVKGTVKDSGGSPIIGATIVVAEGQTGTVTNVDGEYQIKAESDATLLFSYLGYTTQSIAVNNQTAIDVTLISSSTNLDEVVVVGYGTQRKTDVTSAVASIKSDQFAKVVTSSSPLQMIQGKVPGLNMSRAGGADPTKDMSMQIRGMSTINAGSEPLVVIDGIPGGSLATVSPNDIESIDVLRDGSAAAIYGSRGTSGVIIITTKKAKAGSGVVAQYDGMISFNQIYNQIDLLTADEYRGLKADLMASDSPLAQKTGNSMVDYGGNTNWLDEVSNDVFNHQHYVSLSTASKNFTGMASMTYNDFQGVVKTTGKEELNARVSTEFRHFDDILKVNFNVAYTSKTQNPAQTTSLRIDPLTQAILWNPTLSPYQEDGSYTPTPDSQVYYNPVNLIEEYDREDKHNTLQGDAKITIAPMKGLNLTAHFGLNRTESNYAYYQTTENVYATQYFGVDGKAERKYGLNNTKTMELTADYNTALTDKLSFDVLGGYSYQLFENEGFDMTNSGFTFNSTTYNSIGSGSALKDGLALMNSSKGSSKLIAFFGRAVLNYDNRYLFNATVRREGSSRFGLNNQWGTFPAFSFAWRIINEDFMADQNIFSDLKLRAGYGVTGNMFNQNYLNYVLFQASEVYAHNGSLSGNPYNPVYAPKANANPDLKWETKAEWNFGLDMGFLEDRLTANIDLYNRSSRDLLYKYNVSVPPYLTSEIWGNVGTISNKGIEVGINAVAVSTKDLTLNINLNGSYNKNNIDALTTPNGETQVRYENQLASPLNSAKAVVTQVGQPIGNFWAQKYAGVTADGETLVYMLDDNKEIMYDDKGDAMTQKWVESSKSDQNNTIVGNGMPEYYLNLGTTLNYKNFDFSFMLRGAFGFDIMNLNSVYLGDPNFNRCDNALKSALTSDNFDVPSLTDKSVERGDYVKLDNISLGYNIPVDGKFPGTIRVYGAIQNICTITGYSGQNPELEINGTVVGVDKVDAYPITRTYSLGVKLTF